MSIARPIHEFDLSLNVSFDVSFDELMMDRALALAQQAFDDHEVPVGAVVVDQAGRVIGQGYNQSISCSDPTAHAEIQVLRAAGAYCSNYRLTGASLYVTIEPCCMCFGAMVHARISRLVYGAPEPRAGVIEGSAVGGLCLPRSGVFNHRFEITSGVRANQARALMQNFFEARRRR